MVLRALDLPTSTSSKVKLTWTRYERPSQCVSTTHAHTYYMYVHILCIHSLIYVQEKTFVQPQDVAGRDARRVPTIVKTGLDGDEIEGKERSRVRVRFHQLLCAMLRYSYDAALIYMYTHTRRTGINNYKHDPARNESQRGEEKETVSCVQVYQHLHVRLRVFS